MKLLKQLLSFILSIWVHAASFSQQITFNKVTAPGCDEGRDFIIHLPINNPS